MKYSIPVKKFAKLEKIITKYQKKGASITFEVGEKVIEQGRLFVNDAIRHCSYDYPIDVECIEVFVEGTYVINGWHFVGTIDFTENGNIIRLADSSYEGKIPARYLHTPKICEHCGKIRNRKDTYLIASDEGEFKQVGSSCLLDYTHGLDADECADIMSCLNKVMNLSNFDFDADSFMGDGFTSNGVSMNRSTVLGIVYDYVRQYGYQRMSEGKGTAQDIMTMLWHGMDDEEMTRRYESLKPVSEEQLKEVDDFARNYFDSDNDYMRNASLAWSKDSIEYRDFGLVSSFANTFFKEKDKEAQKAQKMAQLNNEYVGNIGDRITIKVKSARVLYTKYSSFGSTYVQELTDTDGHVYIWSTQDVINCYLNGGVVNDEGKPVTNEDGTLDLKATVKAHNEYKTIKQTVITRGTVQISN